MTDLFDHIPTREPETIPFVRGSETSKQAAESIRHILPHLERVVFDAIKSRGQHGATCEECETATGLPHQTASARIRGLAIKGAIALSGAKRRTRSGRHAGVYVSVWREVA